MPWPGPRVARRRRPCWRADVRPQLGQDVVQPVRLERLATDAQGLAPGGAERRVRRRPRCGALAVEVALGHRHRPVDEVAEVVGEVGVVAPDDEFSPPLRRGRTGPRARPRSGRRRLERRHEVVRVEEVAAALAHPLAAGRHQEPVDPDVARRLESRAPQHRRPEDRMEADDVLADDVEVGRPPVSETGRIVGEARAGDVVDQRVVPDVDLAGGQVPRPIEQQRGRAVLANRERDAQSPGVRSRLIENPPARRG